MKETVISAAGILFSKNIPFCVYRFPGDDLIRLAIASKYIAKTTKKTFWIAPFTSQSAAKEIFLPVVDEAVVDKDFLQEIASLPDLKKTLTELPPETSVETYFKNLNTFLDEIQGGILEKIILSRVFYENKPDDFDEVACFAMLEKDYPNAFVYLFQHPQTGVWLGAPPESLLKKRGTDFYTMALAGTQKRNAGRNYYWRRKEIDEHELVGRHIQNIFEKNGLSMVYKPERKTIESGSVAHLRTDYIFHDEQGVSLEKLLSELHPTPAVGGLPVKESVASILQHEGYDRQYYCGFVGETDYSRTADLFVNLRCMQIGTKQIAVYVGSGITAASDPVEEWEETVVKSKTMVEKINPAKQLVK